MQFELNSEQKAYQQMAREFADKEITPYARELDENEEFPWEILKKLHSVGLHDLAVPEKYGGPGIDSLSYSLIIEQIARGCAGVTVTSSANGNSLALYPLLLGGTEEQKQRFLPPICKEGKLVTFSLTEPNAGSDVSAIATTARKDGNYYIINGSKCFITNATYSEYHTVFANVIDDSGAKKLSVFMIEPGTPGVIVGKKEKKLGLRCSDTAELFFEDVRVPKENLIGEEGEGFKLAMKTLDMARPSVGAISLGIAQAAFEAAVEYSKTRVQFGRPICKNQGIQFMLADMATEIEAARLLVYQASWLKDKFLYEGRPFTREAAFAKVYASDVAMKVTTDAVQILGGFGYTRESLVEKYMRDAKIMQIFEGTNQIQRIVIAGRVL
ncbi:MAG: acyl-CoA dehydrogenase, partial [Firmicutes bacterium]|nr:acyl-CoA dehydrogenase [Bacillota bacterium]